MVDKLTIQELIKAGAHLDDEIEIWHGDDPKDWQHRDQIPPADVSFEVQRRTIVISIPRQDAEPEERGHR